MDKVIIQNETIENVIRKDVQQVTQTIFENVVKLNYFRDIAKDIANACIGELSNQSFMTVNLELTEKQKEILSGAMNQIVDAVVNTYVGNIKRDERTKATVEIVENNIKRIIEQTLCDIGQEINRGCCINSSAVKADAKNENYNTIELRHSKHSGDITVPTKGIFVSSNCVDLILNSVKIETNKGE